MKIAGRYGWEAASRMTDIHRPAPQVHERKVVQCEHWKAKECFVGSNCLYLHGHVKPGKKGLCINYMKGKCKKGSSCIYQHIDIHVRQYELLSEKANNYEELEKLLPRCDGQSDEDLIREAANVSLNEQTKCSLATDSTQSLIGKKKEEKKSHQKKVNLVQQQQQQQQQQQHPQHKSALWNNPTPRMWAAAPASRGHSSIWNKEAPLNKLPAGAICGVIRPPNPQRDLHEMKSHPHSLERTPPWSPASYRSRYSVATFVHPTHSAGGGGGGGGGSAIAPTNSLQPPAFADVKRYSDNSESESSSSIDDTDGAGGGGNHYNAGSGSSDSSSDSNSSSSSSSTCSSEFKRKPMAHWTIGDVKAFIAQCGKAPAWAKYSKVFETEQVDGATLAMYTTWQPLVDELNVRKNHARVIANLVQLYNSSNVITFKREFHEEKRIIGA